MKPFFVDIETYSPQKPSIGDKIIAIGYGREKHNIEVLKEWNSEEKEILFNFWKFISEKARRKTVIGHNILRFDVPCLTSRMKKYEIAENSKIENTFHDIFFVDTLQNFLPTNNFYYKGLTLKNIANSMDVEQPIYEGAEIHKFYRKNEHEKIVSHLESDIRCLMDLFDSMKAKAQDLNLSL